MLQQLLNKILGLTIQLQLFQLLQYLYHLFVLAVLLQYVFAVKLRWFPVAGWEGFSTAVLPSLALSAAVLATVSRYIRAEMIEVLSSDYILLARAKGNSTMRVLFGHALRNL